MDGVSAQDRFGVSTAIFALKCLIAALLALYVALAIGLERPYWAFLTSFIVAQPLAGAVLSKALYRVIGTFAGAAFAVAAVPALVDAPELLSFAFACWLAACVFVSLLDRSPRAYMFVLAGYSACIVGLPSVEAPAQIFATAALRVQEITLGILCGGLVHGLIMPGSVTELLLARVRDILGDAARWSADAIAWPPQENLAAERHRLASDITELLQLSTHLLFETSRLAPRARTVRALLDQLSLLLPLGAAVEDRLAVLEAGHDMPDDAATLLADARAWLLAPSDDRDARTAAAAALIERAAALEPATRPDMGWNALLLLSLLARLSTLIAAHRDAHDLYDQMVTHRRAAINPRVAALIDGRRGRELHRDYGVAARGAFGAFLTLGLACALWIASGWRDGAGAAMMAGVFLALFAGADDPVVPIRGFLFGTIIAAGVGAIYGFAILPRLDGFAMLAAALAPALLIGGALTASRWGGIALPAMLGLGSPVLISARYSADFASFINGSLAQLVGTCFAIVMAGLLNAAGAEAAIARLIRAGWRDIARRSTAMDTPDVRGWINRMLDRLAQLAPRVATLGPEASRPLYDVLRDLRTGVAIGELRQLRLALPPVDAAPLAEVLRGVGAYYRRREPERPGEPAPALLAGIDRAIAGLTVHPDGTIRRDAALGLVSLRRNLFPGAPDWRLAA